MLRKEIETQVKDLDKIQYPRIILQRPRPHIKVEKSKIYNTH